MAYERRFVAASHVAVQRTMNKTPGACESAAVEKFPAQPTPD